MKPNPNDMLIFLSIVETRSLTAAAQTLGLTKSAISQSLNRLELDLDTRLLLRNTRSISLTEDGTQLLKYCQKFRDLYHETQTIFQPEKNNFIDTLSITAPHSLSEKLVVPSISNFMHANPNIRIRYLVDDNRINLIEKQIDVAIRVGETEQQTASISKIAALVKSLYVSKNYLDKKGGLPSDLIELSGWDHIAHELQGSVVTYQLDDTNQITATPIIRSNSILTMMDLVSDGHGIAKLPDLIVKTQNKTNSLYKILPITQTPVFAVHHYENKPPMKVQSFIKILRSNFKKL